MTLLKPGDVWDHQEWTRRLVGMRLCEKCIPRFTALMLRGYKPDVFRITFFGSIMLFAGGLFSMPTAQSAPLVSIAELFNGPIETNRGKC